jgi:hypothetical protein
MKTKNALGGLLGLFGSFSALVFLTESLQQKQTNSNQNHNPKKKQRDWMKGAAKSNRTWSRRRWTSPSPSSRDLQNQIQQNHQQQPYQHHRIHNDLI